MDISYSSDPRTVTSAFEGEAVDIEITSNKIAVLSQVSGEKKLFVFSYSDDGIGDIVQTQDLSDALQNAVMLTSYKDDLILVTSSSGARL